MNNFVFTIPNRLQSIKLVLCVSLILSMLLSYKLWLVPNNFASIILLTNLSLPQGVISCLGIVSCLLLIGAMFLRKERLLIFLAVLIHALLAINNINLLQPWFIIYNFSLLIFCFYKQRVDDANNFTSIFICLQLVIIAVYFFNGLTKLNTNFVSDVFEPLVSSLKWVITDRQFNFFIKLGSIVPYLLIFISITLSIRYLRYLAVTLILLINTLLLFFLFPSQLQPNVALWLMNIVMLLLVLILFLGKTKQRYFNNTILLQKGVFYFVVSLFFVLPAQCIFTNSSKYFAFNFYSEKQENKLFLSTRCYNNLPYYLRYFCAEKGNLYELNTQAWSMNALGTTHINEPFVIMRINEFVSNQCFTGVKD